MPGYTIFSSERQSSTHNLTRCVCVCVTVCVRARAHVCMYVLACVFFGVFLSRP